MKLRTRQKFRELAKTNGWPLAHAEGYVDGQTVRRRGKMPSKYALIGIDEIRDGQPLGPHGGDDLIGLGLLDPLVVGTMGDQQRLGDPVRLVERRAIAQQGLALGRVGVTNAAFQHLALRFPICGHSRSACPKC